MNKLTLVEMGEAGVVEVTYNDPSAVQVNKLHDAKLASIQVTPRNGFPVAHTASDINLHAVKIWKAKE